MRQRWVFVPVYPIAVGVLASLPAKADDDRLVLRSGAIQVDGDANLKGGVDIAGQSYAYSSGRLDFGKRTVPRVEGIFRFSKRNRLVFNYFRYDNDESHVLAGGLDIGGDTVPAGTTAQAKAKFDLGSVVYDYAIVETPTMRFGAQIGAAWADLKGTVRLGNALWIWAAAKVSTERRLVSACASQR